MHIYTGSSFSRDSFTVLYEVSELLKGVIMKIIDKIVALDQKIMDKSYKDPSLLRGCARIAGWGLVEGAVGSFIGFAMVAGIGYVYGKIKK